MRPELVGGARRQGAKSLIRHTDYSIIYKMARTTGSEKMKSALFLPVASLLDVDHSTGLRPPAGQMCVRSMDRTEIVDKWQW